MNPDDKDKYIPAKQAQVTIDILLWLYNKWSIYTHFMLLNGEIVIELITDLKTLGIYVEKNGTISVLQVGAGDKVDIVEYKHETRDSLLKWLDDVGTK